MRATDSGRLAAVREELGDTAIVVQGLAHRLQVHGRAADAQAAHAAARELAAVVCRMNGGRPPPAVSLHFPSATAAASAAEDTEQEGADDGVPD